MRDCITGCGVQQSVCAMPHAEMCAHARAAGPASPRRCCGARAWAATRPWCCARRCLRRPAASPGAWACAAAWRCALPGALQRPSAPRSCWVTATHLSAQQSLHADHWDDRRAERASRHVHVRCQEPWCTDWATSANPRLEGSESLFRPLANALGVFADSIWTLALGPTQWLALCSSHLQDTVELPSSSCR